MKEYTSVTSLFKTKPAMPQSQLSVSLRAEHVRTLGINQGLTAAVWSAHTPPGRHFCILA